jgi:hypothetical protein
MRAFCPAFEDDFGRRRPPKVLPELGRTGKFDQDAAEVEEKQFGADSGMLHRQQRPKLRPLSPAIVKIPPGVSR